MTVRLPEKSKSGNSTWQRHRTQRASTLMNPTGMYGRSKPALAPEIEE